MSGPPPIRAEGEVLPPDFGSPTGRDEAQDHFGPALAIAVVADAVQLLAFPLFAPGGLSPVEGVLDVVVGLIMVRLLGWHWAFLPSFLGELIPFVDELPCWTLAVLFVKAQRKKLKSS